MRTTWLGLLTVLLALGCSSGDPPAPDTSADTAKQIEAQIKEAQSKEGQFRRGKSD